MDMKLILTPSRASGAGIPVCGWYFYYIPNATAITSHNSFPEATHHHIFIFGSATFVVAVRSFSCFLRSLESAHSSAIQQNSARKNVIRSLLRCSPLLPYSKQGSAIVALIIPALCDLTLYLPYSK